MPHSVEEVIKPFDYQLPADSSDHAEEVVQSVDDKDPSDDDVCISKVLANAVNAAVQPINHSPHQVPPVQSDNIQLPPVQSDDVSHSQLHSEQMLYNTQPPELSIPKNNIKLGVEPEPLAQAVLAQQEGVPHPDHDVYLDLTPSLFVHSDDEST